MIIQWLLSRTVREAVAMRKHVWKILCAQRDLLSPQAIEGVAAATSELQKTVAAGADRATLSKQMQNLEIVANKWLKPYPNAAWRENVEVLLVALAVALAIRTFFLQPFKIPTGSMQPTLYGVTSVPDFAKARSQAEVDEQIRLRDAIHIPSGWLRVRDWFAGVTYLRVIAENDGELQSVEQPMRLLIFNIRQRLLIGGHWQTIWFPPDYGAPPQGTLEARAGLRRGQVYRKGEDVVRLRVNAGDHLFVDRWTYNFRLPKRGEIIVFETKGIAAEQRQGLGWSIPDDQFYIKRLVALGGEHVRIGADQHLIIDGRRLDSSDPGFENVYGFKANAGENEYFGHTPIARFYDTNEEFAVQPNHLMVMGDNTRSSLDSRFFGDFSRDYVMGKAWFVYWPITSRFGWGYR
jgi:signal peptidase I